MTRTLAQLAAAGISLVLAIVAFAVDMAIDMPFFTLPGTLAARVAEFFLPRLLAERGRAIAVLFLANWFIFWLMVTLVLRARRARTSQ